MANYPALEQDPWFDDLKAYIDERFGLSVEDRSAAESTVRELVLSYDAEVDDPDIYRIRYIPPSGIAEGLALIHQVTLALNEIGYIRLQQSADAPTDTPFRIFGRGDTGEFSAPPLQIIPDRLNQSVVSFEVNPDGRIDNGKYPWTTVDLSTGSNLTRYTTPGGTTYWPASIRRATSDRCEFRGSVNVSDSAISAGDILGVLPTEFRPSRVARITFFAGGGAQTVRAEIGVDGSITLQTPRASAAGYLSLDGATYTL